MGYYKTGLEGHESKIYTYGNIVQGLNAKMKSEIIHYIGKMYCKKYLSKKVTCRAHMNINLFKCRY